MSNKANLETLLADLATLLAETSGSARHRKPVAEQPAEPKTKAPAQKGRGGEPHHRSLPQAGARPAQNSGGAERHHAAQSRGRSFQRSVRQTRQARDRARAGTARRIKSPARGRGFNLSFHCREGSFFDTLRRRNMDAKTTVDAIKQEFLPAANSLKTYTVTYTLSHSHNLSRCISNCL